MGTRDMIQKGFVNVTLRGNRKRRRKATFCELALSKNKRCKGWEENLRINQAWLPKVRRQKKS